MRKHFRYLLVGFLTVVMTVDSASAVCWWDSYGYPYVCDPIVVEVIPPTDCCYSCCSCDSDIVVEATPVYDSCGCASVDDGHYEYYDQAPGEPVEQEMVAPPQESTRQQSQPESSEANKPATEPDASRSPAPVAVPEQESPQPTTPTTEAESEPAEDSLFDSDPAPAEVPAETAPSPDIFDEPTATEKSAPQEDMPAEPATEESQPESADPLQDLFGAPSGAEAPAVESSPADIPPASEQPASEDLPSPDDLFNEKHDQRSLSVPGGLASQSTRQWTDNTGLYHCEARMLRASSEKVLLAKSNGKQVVVRFSRLSDEDLKFVKQQVSAQQDLLAKQAASEKLASLWSD